MTLTTRLEAWHKAGEWFNFGNRRIFFRREGQGPNLLCLHGFPTASFDWYAVWPRLTAQFTVLAPDLLGYGFSDKPADHTYSVAEQAEMIEALAADQGMQQAHILAHDYGDTVTQELLARFRERKRSASPGLQLLSACLLNGGLFPETHRPRLVQKLLLTPLGPLIGRLYNEKKFAKSFSAVFGPRTQPKAEELSEFWHLIRNNGGDRIIHLLIGYLRERKTHRERWVRPLLEPDLPIRVINGPMDPVSGGHMVANYRRLVAEAGGNPPDVVMLEEHIGHYPQVEAPQAVADAFEAFHRDSAVC